VTEATGIISRAQSEFERMSRSSRLIFGLGIVLIIFLLWSSVIDPISAGWNDAADDIATQTARVEKATSQAAAQRSNVVAFGPLASPLQRSTESQDMLEAVNAIMSEFAVRGYEFDEASSAVKVGGSSLPGIDRIKATLGFDAEHEKAIEIIGAIEDSPAIEAISNARVQRSKVGGRVLAIELTIEAWVRGGKRR
jgi:type II secretory pathway component PulM